MAMECELVRLAGVPMGLVTSALFYTTTNKPGSRQADFEVGTRRHARVCIYSTYTVAIVY